MLQIISSCCYLAHFTDDLEDYFSYCKCLEVCKSYFKFCWFGVIKSCFIKTTHLIEVRVESFDALNVRWESFTIKTDWLFVLYSLPCIFAEYFCIKFWLMYTLLLVLQYYIVIISREYRVGQIKRRHCAFLLVTNECICQNLWFLAHINYIKRQIRRC